MLDEAYYTEDYFMGRLLIIGVAIILATVIIALGTRYEYVMEPHGFAVLRGDRWGMTSVCLAAGQRGILFQNMRKCSR